MKKLSLFLVALAMILVSCKPEIEKPTVVTKSVGEVTETSAKVVGQVTEDGGAEVTERGVCWNTEGAPEVVDFRTKDGSGIGSFTSNIPDLVPNTQYYVRAYATNEKGVSYGEELTLTTLKEIELPTVATAEVKDVTETTAVSGGEVVSDGGAEVTARGICWSTKQNPTIEDDKTTDGKGVGSFTSQIPNLVPNTQYYVRAYATNEVGTSYGDEKSFTTLEVTPEEPGDEPEEPGDEPEEPGDEPEEPGDEPENPGDEPETPEQPEEVAPVVTTAEVTEITVNSAKCGGEVINGGDAVVVARGVCWNTSGQPTVSDTYTMNGTNVGSFTSQISNLVPNTQYYVRAYATNAKGVTGYGEEVSFTTLEKLLPTVTTTVEVTNITVSSATCGGEVTFDGNVTVTARGICWSTSQNPTIEDNKTTDGYGVGSFTSQIPNLVPNTQYYVRAYATNEVGTAYGEEVTFTTLEKFLPTVITAEVTDITVSSAVCGGEVTFDGNVAVTAKGICWSTSQNPTIEDNKTTDGYGVGSFTSQIPNLVPNTQYYVRAYAINEVGTAYGEERTFTTLSVYSPATGSSNGYGYVDLGLSVKWATCNVGATTPEEYGDYFAWGETTMRAEYDTLNYPINGLSKSELQSQGYIDSEGNLTSQYDAATANWGGNWRMPTNDELEELIKNCTWKWISLNGFEGYEVTGPNGNSIFLPAAGYRRVYSLRNAGSYGSYWSSTPYEYYYNFAYYLHFDSSGHRMNYYYRSSGLSVRPILE